LNSSAFLFPGQGAQFVGMGRQLAESLPAARSLYDQAKVILGYDLADICFHGPAERLDSTVISQPALFVTSLAALEQLKVNEPQVVESAGATAGLSLGEYTAMVFADVMSFEDGLKLVQRRGEAMQAAADANPSGMVAVLGLERTKVDQLVEQARGDGVLRVANLLCPGNIAVSGSCDGCERIAELAEKAGAMKVAPLAVAGAFHTPLMDSAVSQLAEAIANVTLSSPQIPVVSNVDARPHEDPEEIRELLIKQVVSPVLWEGSIRYLIAEGFTSFYEIGPGRVLKGLMKRIDRKVSCENVTA